MLMTISLNEITHCILKKELSIMKTKKYVFKFMI